VASGLQLSDTAATVLSGGLMRATGENVGSYAGCGPCHAPESRFF
jgi:hypothetical protein